VPEVSSPLLPRRELAVTLRRLRLEAGKTLGQAGEALEVSAATISRYETGHRLPRGRDVRDLCLLYGLAPGPRLDRLVAMATEAREPGWWESYSELEDDASIWIGLEAAAQAIDTFEAAMVPGLLQTPDYTRALLRGGPFRVSGRPFTDREIEHHVEIRQRRQAALAARSTVMRVVVDEAGLARRVGSSAVMRNQLTVMADIAESGKVDLRVLPFDAGAHPGILGSFMIASVESDVIDGVVYTHSTAGEFAVDDPTELSRYHSLFAILYELSLDVPSSVAALRLDRWG
jgi:transcriptional regulator with XRE-family HTH domain